MFSTLHPYATGVSFIIVCKGTWRYGSSSAKEKVWVGWHGAEYGVSSVNREKERERERERERGLGRGRAGSILVFNIS
jgi:hypothetical protein